MRKDLGSDLLFFPLPVAIISTFDDKGNANAMNAAWSGIIDYGKIYVSLSHHKTTDNLMINKAFCLSFATKKTLEISDYFGIVSGFKEDKIKKSKVNLVKSKHVNAPIILEYPLTLECEVESFKDGILIGKVVNVSVDEEYLKEDKTLDIEKMELITYDMSDHSYRVIKEKVGSAFKDGLKVK